MTITSFGCGMIPLFLHVKQESMNTITLFGAGLLLGTALGVIIPEGTILIIRSNEIDVQVGKVAALCLITGFCLMLMIEQISNIFTHQTHSVVAVSAMSSTRDIASSNNNSSTMIGILIHSLADGVAFASVSISDHVTLETIVFLAIILHKSPAAFGLSCFLIGNGESRKNVRRFQMLFSLSAVSYSCFMIAFNVYIDFLYTKVGKYQ